tara:strand:- start:1587 stop:2108 length:522 start_codon:yes stop_codon:yes gene_type:complete
MATILLKIDDGKMIYLKNNIYTICFLFFIYSTVFADNFYIYDCPSTESALNCNKLCEILDRPKIIFSFKVNEKNNVVIRTQDYFNVDNKKILGIPIALRNCSVISNDDWVCGREKEQRTKLNIGAYIDLIHRVRYVDHKKNILDDDKSIVHIMRDGQYSVLRFNNPSMFRCAK